MNKIYQPEKRINRNKRIINSFSNVFEKSVTQVAYIEHFDQNESDGNAATKYIVEFTNRVNCDWLWKTLANALEIAQQK